MFLWQRKSTTSLFWEQKSRQRVGPNADAGYWPRSKAIANDIRKAYRKMAHKCHLDKNKLHNTKVTTNIQAL